MRVALVVDNPLRDLPGIVLVALTLCDHGATCYLVPMNLAQRELCALAPDFVLLNYLRRANEALAQMLLDAGIGLGVLDTEGGVFPSFDSYAATMAQGSKTRLGIACYCAWGHQLARHVVEQGWYRSDQVVVTGAPRFDFYVPPWRAAALRMSSEYVGGCPPPIILVNGSFALANPAFTSPEEEAKLWAKSGHDPYEVARWQEGQRATMACFAELANNLARRFSDATFVYRPHPFERVETYHRLLDTRDNLRLTRAGTVDGWILRAAAVIQHGSSTAVEAGLAGVPALFPAWIPTAMPLRVPEVASVQCASEGELIERLELVLAGRGAELMAALEQTLAGVVRDWFCASDGKAHDRVAQAVLQHARPCDPKERLRACRRALYGGLDGGVRARASGAVRRALGLPPDWSFRRWRIVVPASWDRSLKRFGVREVAAIVTAVEEASRGSAQMRIGVRAAQCGCDYYFDYTAGRSVVLAPSGE